jgi:hypothetical protein
MLVVIARPAGVQNRIKKGLNMNYNQACDKVEKLAKQYGYKAVGIEYHGAIRGPGRYLARAKNAAGIKVILAFSSSYAGMVSETEEYLKTVNTDV